MPSHILEVFPIFRRIKNTRIQMNQYKRVIKVAPGTHSLDLDAGVDRFRALCYSSSHHQPPFYWLVGDSCNSLKRQVIPCIFFSVPVFLGDIIGSLAAWQ